MSEKDRQKKDHGRTEKKNKQMRERENSQRLGAAPRHQAKAESNLSEENTQKPKGS
jgi:hypothetical protein